MARVCHLPHAGDGGWKIRLAFQRVSGEAGGEPGGVSFPLPRGSPHFEEASSGGLVCGLQRRVYQDQSSAVHSHRIPLRDARNGLMHWFPIQTDYRPFAAPSTHWCRNRPSGPTSPSSLPCRTPSRRPSSRLAWHSASTPHAGGDCKGRIAPETKFPGQRGRRTTPAILMAPRRPHRPPAPRARGHSGRPAAGECPPRCRRQPWRPMPSSMP